jgi:hypothetical protein
MTTSYPHRLRLLGPWECEAPAGAEPQRVTMPCRLADCGLAGFSGTVRFRRRFGYPGRIDAEERVWLTFAGVSGAAELRLNGQILGRHAEGAEAFEHEVTALLRPRNELLVDLEAADDRAGLGGEVAMEVRRTAFLRGVRAGLVREGHGTRLHIAGEVVGTSDQPLEVYALLDSQTVLYGVVQAVPEGRPFQQTSDVLDVQPGPGSAARVDLIAGAVIWYSVEVPLCSASKPLSC